MQPIRHILLPIDFSSKSLGLAPLVEALAREYNAQITLVHVVETLAAFPLAADLAAVPVELPAARLRLATKAIEDFAPGQFAGLKLNRVVLSGDAATRIVEYARENACDLIAMSTHGYGRFRRFLLGSVTA